MRRSDHDPDDWEAAPEDPRPARCPACGADAPLPVVYGYPGHDMVEALERGEIALGGCVIVDDAPAWACRSCGHRWGGQASRIEGVAADVPDSAPSRPDASPGTRPTPSDHETSRRWSP